MNYLKGINYMKITLTVDIMSVINPWVDVSHHTHMECRGHTGAMMSLGKVSEVSYSGKHKLNKKRLTELDLISDDEMLVKML